MRTEPGLQVQDWFNPFIKEITIISIITKSVVRVSKRKESKEKDNRINSI